MTEETRVSLSADELRQWEPEDALAFADEHLGDSGLWQPSLIAYRLASDFQEDWKVEVGCWLKHAQQFGFLERLLKRMNRARHEARAPHVTGPNDSAHKILAQELAPAMVAYYFAHCGWTFVEWEPRVAGADVDVRLKCPLGIVTDFQVKAPDQPGWSGPDGIHDGEYDKHILLAIDGAMAQLSSAPGPQRIVVVTPQRTFPVAPMVLAAHLVGETWNRSGDVTLDSSRRGTFAKHTGSHVGAVIDLHLVRGENMTLYRCTVLLNPWLKNGQTPGVDAFKGARICSLVDGRFVWMPEQPDRAHWLPTGTRYIE